MSQISREKNILLVSVHQGQRSLICYNCEHAVTIYNWKQRKSISQSSETGQKNKFSMRTYEPSSEAKKCYARHRLGLSQGIDGPDNWDCVKSETLLLSKPTTDTCSRAWYRRSNKGS